MEATSTYNKGLSFDIDRLKMSNDVYVDGENIRLQSIDGNMFAIL